MGLSSTVTTIHAKGLKAKGTKEEFNEAIHDAWEAEGWEWQDAAKSITMKSGRRIDWVSEISRTQFLAMGYESEHPESYIYMYAMFNINYAQAIADNISEGELILSHEVEGNGTEYYMIVPGKAEHVDLTRAILSHYGL